ncbi:MAG TPA: hypothetical protein PK078_06945 [Anaerolineales bacterium]|nr:hypothetical protein [Anaerolineales bacterium]HNB36585.1 hypothetical protein [Anaerolineales bacterium]
MENLPAWLLNFDTMILIILFLGAFITWEIRAGEIPLRWFGSIRRDMRPFIYWIGILLHLLLLSFLVYLWMIGIRVPVSIFFEESQK